MSRHLTQTSRGFTLIELVVVMVVLGILAAVAVPVFFDVQTYKERAAYDEVAGAVRYAQKMAVASGCNIQVKIVNNEYQLGRAVPCDVTDNFIPLDENFPIYSGPEENVTLTAADFYFDSMGRCSTCPSTGEVITVGNNGLKITVIAETGYVDVDAP